TVLDRAGTYWYHPHPHGRTGPQVYFGVAGLFLIGDEEEASLGLPGGEYDVPLVIQDRFFDEENQLIYGSNGMMDQMMGFLGNRILVNGQPEFTLPVATRPYRLRLHNGSNSRIYKLGWEDGTPLTVIATDGGLLEAPVQKDAVTLAPAQRIELWMDFSERELGDSLRLMNIPHAAPGGGTSFLVLTAVVDRAESVSATLPERLSTVAWRNEADAVNRRSPRDFSLAMGRGMQWMLNGRTFEMTNVADNETVKLGDLEVWQFSNLLGSGMGMMGESLPHPMHVHGLQYQIIEREIDSGANSAWDTLRDGIVDEGWHDTVLVMPGERVKILLKFEDFTGLYLYHCHNLEHEDMGMMRNYLVEA
ncbi:MAG TPA: multicopper oxidase domain-containing protein, partial [Anaerolineales bacterium]|nr:multicopper oxidase domain-containing protein [Anaerolineales bacterium]